MSTSLRKTRFRPRALVAALLPLCLAACAGSGEYEAALEEGLALYRKGHFRLAAERLEIAADLDDGEALPRLYLGRAQIRLGRMQEAETHLLFLLNRIGLDEIESAADRTSLLTDLGALSLRHAMDQGETGSFFKAQGFFERALAVTPGADQALLGKGLALFGLDKLYEPGGDDSAHRTLSAYAASHPADPVSRYYLALCNEKDRRLSSLEAIELLEKVIALHGNPETLTHEKASITRAFDVPVDALDKPYALLACERLVPLLARVDPEDLGLDGAEIRERARDRLDLYHRLGGRFAFPRAVLDWLEGAAAVEGGGTAPGGGGSGSTPRETTGIRPALEILAPAQGDVKTNDDALTVTVRGVDDASGVSLKVERNGRETTPEFDLKIEDVDVQGRKGERRTWTFRVPLERGDNVILLRAVDRDGLTSEERRLTAAYRPPSLIAVAAGCNGPAGAERALRFAEEDARDFMRLLDGRFAVPPPNRTLLAGREATAEAFLAAVRDAAARAWESDALVVFFSGFGGSVEERRGPERLLVFSDFDPKSSRQNPVLLSGFGKLLEKTRARRITLIFDAGFGPAGEGAKTWPGLEGHGESWKGRVENLLQLGPELASRTTVILGADAPGSAREVKSDNPRQRSGGLLTTYLLEALDAPEGAADVGKTPPPQELRAFLLTRVSYYAAREGGRQTPLVAGPEGVPVLPR